MEKELEKPAILFGPNRYWAGRHQPQSKILPIAMFLAEKFPGTPFPAEAIDEAVRIVSPSQEGAISKGTRWAYLKVQRDVGLIAQETRNNYTVTSWGSSLLREPERWQEWLVRGIFQGFDTENPLHVLLNLFIERWTDDPLEFVEQGQLVEFRRTSAASLWIMGPKESNIQGFGKNEFNQVWNGLLPFLERLCLLGQFDLPASGFATRGYSPIRDWFGPITPDQLVFEVETFIDRFFPQGKMISLSEFVSGCWKELKVSPNLALEALYLATQKFPGKLHLVRAPLAVAEEMKFSNIVKPGATYGAFVRRPKR